MNHPLPINEIRPRYPEHGRIRLGVRTAKAFRSIDTFRFTSPDRTAIEQLAAKYGGEARPWHDDLASPRDQWEVITTVNEITVVLPSHDSLSIWYEKWSRGGLQRRCDGEICDLADGRTVDCLCFKAGKRTCRPVTRLNGKIFSSAQRCRFNRK